MLLTSRAVPVAQEFSGVGLPGRAGSEFSPVRAECPIAMIPTGEVDADWDGDCDVVEVASSSPPQALSAITQRITAQRMTKCLKERR